MWINQYSNRKIKGSMGLICPTSTIWEVKLHWFLIFLKLDPFSYYFVFTKTHLEEQYLLKGTGLFLMPASHVHITVVWYGDFGSSLMWELDFKMDLQVILNRRKSTSAGISFIYSMIQVSLDGIIDLGMESFL